MIKTLVFKGIKYNGVQESIQSTIQKMLDLANKEKSFVYGYINGTPIVIEPNMSFDEAIDTIHDIRHGKITIAICSDTANNISPVDMAKSMAVLAKQNDFVISSFNGIVFRILKNMSAEDAIRVFNKIIHHNSIQNVSIIEMKQRKL
jgi:hypothetical protein